MTIQENFLKTISQIQDTTDQNTEHIFHLTRSLKEQGFLTKEVALKILKWKSPRPLKHYEKNTDDDFELITKNAFLQTNEKLKIHILTALTGVNYPSASAILMFYDQTKYPVIDIRVWRQLHKNQFVTENPNGQNFRLSQWIKYLDVIRKISKELEISPRQLEKRLFDYDKLTQIGTLYKTSRL
jgi:thermostable 8-oxoguanine DNA glycosylase